MALRTTFRCVKLNMQQFFWDKVLQFLIISLLFHLFVWLFMFMILEYQWIELYDQANITNGPSKNQTRRCIVIGSNTLMILEHAILQT